MHVDIRTQYEHTVSQDGLAQAARFSEMYHSAGDRLEASPVTGVLVGGCLLFMPSARPGHQDSWRTNHAERNLSVTAKNNCLRLAHTSAPS